MRALRADRPMRSLSVEEKTLYKQISKKHNSLRNELLQTPSKLNSDSSLELTYIRYADDWILCISGPKVFAKYFQNKISSFLHTYLRLELSHEKTKITNFRTSSTTFLGFEPSIRTSQRNPRIK